VMLDDLGPRERAIAEAASVLRRVTLPLLAAVADEPDVEQAWQTLRGLPFTVTTAAGVELFGLAAPVLLEADATTDEITSELQEALKAE